MSIITQSSFIFPLELQQQRDKFEYSRLQFIAIRPWKQLFINNRYVNEDEKIIKTLKRMKKKMNNNYIIFRVVGRWFWIRTKTTFNIIAVFQTFLTSVHATEREENVGKQLTIPKKANISVYHNYIFWKACWKGPLRIITARVHIITPRSFIFLLEPYNLTAWKQVRTFTSWLISAGHSCSLL